MSKRPTDYRDKPSNLRYHTCIKRDLYTSKKTYTLWKERYKRDPCMYTGDLCWNKRDISICKRDLCIHKRDLYTSKETYTLWNETYTRDAYRPPLILCTYLRNWRKEIYTSEKRRIQVKRNQYVWKETYTYEKRPINIERDLHKWKATYIYTKRPTHMERDLHIWKETYIYEKRPTQIQRDLHKWKETYTYEKKPTKERNAASMHIPEPRTVGSAIYGTRTYEKRPIQMKRDRHIWKETFKYEKRPTPHEKLLDCSAIYATHLYIKRDVWIRK